MNLLTSIFTVVHLVAAIAIVVLVLLQPLGPPRLVLERAAQQRRDGLGVRRLEPPSSSTGSRPSR